MIIMNKRLDSDDDKILMMVVKKCVDGVDGVDDDDD